jgi:hypothetical protein
MQKPIIGLLYSSICVVPWVIKRYGFILRGSEEAEAVDRSGTAVRNRYRATANEDVIVDTGACVCVCVCICLIVNCKL